MSKEYIAKESTCQSILTKVNQLAPTTQTKSVTITQNGQSTVTPDSGYNAMTSVGVTVNVPQPEGNINITNTSQTDVSAYATAQVVDADLVASNIKKDVDILGVVGTYEGSGSNAFILVNSISGVTLTCDSQTYTLGADETSHAFEVGIGTHSVSATLGSTTTTSVIVSTATVYEIGLRPSFVPPEYQEVQYLYSNTTSADNGPVINTGFSVDNNSKYEIKFKLKPNGNYMALFGGGKGSSYTRCYLGDAPNTTIWPKISGINSSTIPYDAANEHTLTMDVKGGKIYYDGSVHGSGTPSTFAGDDYPLYLFFNNNEAIRNYGSGYIYYCKCYENNVLAHNFIPCYRKADSVAGMYDTVTGEFKTNMGSGSFVVGGDV